MARLIQIFVLLFFFQSNFSQDELSIFSDVDSTSIKVGQQFTFSIKVESENIEGIIFPEKYNFSPFEIAEEFKLDTTFFKGKKSLIKKFKLTNFEEGEFTIPKQTILFNEKDYLTDLIPIDVRTIKVDTVSKKFFDIKEIILNKEQRIPFIKYLMSILVLILGGLIVFLLYKKFINYEFDKSIFKTPFENAIDNLVSLEKQILSSQDDYKLFYSKLTGIAKDYLEKDIEISAAESTTTQLIDKINLLKKNNKINISDETIASFKDVLSNADLVKFAKYSPKNETALDDNKILKSFIVNTKKSIPNNIEKENEQRKIIEKKINEMQKRRKTKYLIFSISSIFISLVSSVFILFGPPDLSSILVFNEDKKMLKQNWISSTYTDLNLSIDSPDALYRSPDSTINKLTFISSNKNLEINLITKPIDENSDLSNELINDFKERNFINVITKNEDFQTLDGDKGVKIFGSFDDQNLNRKKDYSTILFVVNKLSIKLEIIFERGNANLQKIVDRVINSLKFNK